MGVTKQQIPEVAAFMTEFWEFIKQTYVPESNDDYFKYVAARANQIAGKVKNGTERSLCKKLMAAYLDFLDERSRV